MSRPATRHAAAPITHTKIVINRHNTISAMSYSNQNLHGPTCLLQSGMILEPRLFHPVGEDGWRHKLSQTRELQVSAQSVRNCDRRSLRSYLTQTHQPAGHTARRPHRPPADSRCPFQRGSSITGVNLYMSCASP